MTIKFVPIDALDPLRTYCADLGARRGQLRERFMQVTEAHRIKFAYDCARHHANRPCLNVDDVRALVAADLGVFAGIAVGRRICERLVAGAGLEPAT